MILGYVPQDDALKDMLSGGGVVSMLYKNNRELAVDLEDTAVVISPLIPWCIAGAVPLAIVGAPMTSFLVAVFLYLLPLYRCFGKIVIK